MSNKLTELLATFFYFGKVPFMPGTAASFVGMLLYFIMRGNFAGYIALWLVITGAGFWASGRMERFLGKKDPSSVVIDEVSGIMGACFLLPMTPAVMLITFFVFRAFDMFKIYPVGKFEAMPGSLGIMMDDIVAGIYTNLAMHAAIRLAGWL